MMRKNEDSPKTEKMKLLLDMELRKLDFQLNNIFTAAEIEAGEIANYWSEVNLRLMFEEVKEEFGYLIEEKKLEFVFEITMDPLIVSDAKKLHIIFANLISNACEYSFFSHKVIIHAHSEEDFLVISISNVGDTISSTFKKEIFSRFKKVGTYEGTARTCVDGLGLGLSIVSGLVESLDGEIDYSSSEQETVFTLKLKLQDKEKAEALMRESANEFMFDDLSEMKEF